MEVTTTLMILMAAALVVLAIIVGVLVLHLFHKNDELKEKNYVIVREIRRNQELIDRAVKNGVKRAVLLSSIIAPLLLCAGTTHIPRTNDFLYQLIITDLRLGLDYDSTTDLQRHYTLDFDGLLNTARSLEPGSAEALFLEQFGRDKIEFGACLRETQNVLIKELALFRQGV